MNTRTATYVRPVAVLHWACALLILAAFPLGIYMHDLPLSPEKLRLFSYHKWIGIAVLFLAVPRLLSRVAFATPELPATMHRWERTTAVVMHVLLYALIFAVPLSGWLMSSATGFQTWWFGVVPLPDLVSKSKPLGESLKVLHKGLNLLMLGLVVVHVAAALKHQFIDRDDVLSRMAPGRRASGRLITASQRPGNRMRGAASDSSAISEAGRGADLGSSS